MYLLFFYTKRLKVRELLFTGAIWEDEFLKYFSSDTILCNIWTDWRWYCNHQWVLHSVLGQNLHSYMSESWWSLWMYGSACGWSVLKCKTWRKWWKDTYALSCSTENSVTLGCAVCILQQQRSLRVSLLGTARITRSYLCPHVDPLCRIGNTHCIQVQLQQNGRIQRNFVKPPGSAFCKGSESVFSPGLYKSSISFYASHSK